MPTERPRFQVTETPDVERALELAAIEWPDAGRAERVRRLFHAAAQTLEARQRAVRDRRKAAIRGTAGALTEAYPQGYLDALRADWPA